MLQKMLKKMKKEEGGFTLVELLIVVAIIAILAAIAIPQFSKYRTRAYVTELNSDLKNAFTAAQAYLSDYPSGTVDSIAKLQSAGYNPSENVQLDDGTASNMTLSSGAIYLESTSGALSTAASNNASVTFNGVFTQAQNP